MIVKTITLLIWELLNTENQGMYLLSHLIKFINNEQVFLKSYTSSLILYSFCL